MRDDEDSSENQQRSKVKWRAVIAITTAIAGIVTTIGTVSKMWAPEDQRPDPIPTTHVPVPAASGSHHLGPIDIAGQWKLCSGGKELNPEAAPIISKIGGDTYSVVAGGQSVTDQSATLSGNAITTHFYGQIQHGIVSEDGRTITWSNGSQYRKPDMSCAN